MTDGNGNVLECRDYLPFGEQLVAGRAAVSCMAGDLVRQQFTGKERDAETGLDNSIARYLSSAQGRFMSADPLGNFVADVQYPQSWNLYSYVINNPLRFIDPAGMECVNLDNGTQGDDGQGTACAGAQLGTGGDFTVNGGSASTDYNSSDFSGHTFYAEGLGISSGSGQSGRAGLRRSGQSFDACMATNANDFSLPGLVNHGFNAAFGTNGLAFQNNALVQAVLGNPLTAAFYGSAADAATVAGTQTPALIEKGIGSALSYGRRNTAIVALNLAGKGGVPLALGAASAGTKAAIGRVANVAGGFMSLQVTLAVNAGFTALEAFSCR